MRSGRIPNFWPLLLVGWLSSAQAGVFKEPLPPQELRPALEAFARVTGMQLIYRASLSKSKESGGAAANQSHADTLRQILDGTGLTFELVNSNTRAAAEAAVDPECIIQIDRNMLSESPDRVLY